MRPLWYFSIYPASNQGLEIVTPNIFGKPAATDSAIKVPLVLELKQKMVTRSMLKALRISSDVVLRTSSSLNDSRTQRVIFINSWE